MKCREPRGLMEAWLHLSVTGVGMQALTGSVEGDVLGCVFIPASGDEGEGRARPVPSEIPFGNGSTDAGNRGGLVTGNSRVGGEECYRRGVDRSPG